MSGKPASGRFGVAQALRRPEDRRLLRGGGRYLDDIRRPGETWAVFVRSPHAHAAIRGIETGAARAVPGVLGVWTGADLLHLGAIPFRPLPPAPGAIPLDPPPRRALTTGVARFVGDPVAMVVAATPEQAQDAAEIVEIDWEVLPAVTDPVAAVGAEAPALWPAAPDNVCGVWQQGDRAAVDAAMAAAAHIVAIELVNDRLVAASMEPRGVLADYDGASGRWTLTLGVQMPHLLRDHLCDSIFGVSRDRLRVVVPDIGGGFGMKVFCYPEYAAVMFAAEALGRPVRWRATRSEAFLTDIHGRAQVDRARLALDADGRFLGLEVDALSNVGAYIAFQGGIIGTVSSFRVLSGVYDIPAVHGRARVVLTNTVPTDAYRGAGRPEAIYLIERLVDRAAATLGLDAVDLRRRNLVPKARMPYRNGTGMLIDSGDFAHVLDTALAAADWDRFAARREAATARGRIAGRGLALYIEHTGRNEFTERVDMSVDGDGRVTVLSGTQEMGQGLKTSYIGLVAARLGVPPEAVEIVQGDTDRVASGGGSGGSRSLYVGGSAVVATSDRLIERAKALAAEALEVAEADLVFSEGKFIIAGTDRSIGLSALAARQAGGAIDASETTTVGDLTWPNGCHIAEVEIDPETGNVILARFVTVDDVGVVVNHMIVEGQVHGGVVQGIGQALHERVVFDEAGQPLAGSFMDYALPRASDVPSFTVVADESSPCTTNPLGAKGAGECGATGAPPAVITAVCDALGVDHVAMPVRTEDVWRILRARAS